MEREDFGRCAAQDSADNSRVHYTKEEHGGAQLTIAMRCLLLFVWRRARETGRGRQGGIGGGKTRRRERLLRDQPLIEELHKQVQNRIHFVSSPFVSLH